MTPQEWCNKFMFIRAWSDHSVEELRCYNLFYMIDVTEILTEDEKLKNQFTRLKEQVRKIIENREKIVETEDYDNLIKSLKEIRRVKKALERLYSTAREWVLRKAGD